MSESPKLYIAGMGMITPVGANTAMTAAAVKAGISSYKISNYYGKNDEPITMAFVPNLVLDEMAAEIIEGNRYNERHERVTRMAIMAIREACALCPVQQPIPAVFAMPDEQGNADGLIPVIQNLENNCKPWVSAAQSRSIYHGRAGGMEAINFAFRYINELPGDFMLVGGSDSYRDMARLAPMSKEDRLLTKSNMDGFAPGEAAVYLLLTRRAELALSRSGSIIALHPPGIADETGHMKNAEPYRGDGLDQAFKKALVNQTQNSVQAIYSSMNGENHWAKEYGVAYIRNKEVFTDTVKVEHPADCYGDLGAATSTALIALAVENLFSNAKAHKHLVYSSSDTAKRGAIVVDKLSAPVTH